MKIVCDSCSTKYSISDDKVRGKVFKIRCKKCSHIIVVKGTTSEATPAAVEAPTDAVWHLVVDGDQVGPLTDADVRARLNRNEISAENYVWKDGFSDWLRLADIPDFADVVAASMSAPVAGELFSDSGRADATDIAERHGGEGQGVGGYGGGMGGFFGGAGQAEGNGSSGTPSSGFGESAAFSAGSSAGFSGRHRSSSPDVSAEDDAFSAGGGASAAPEGADLFGAAVPAAARVDSGRVRGRGHGSNGAGASARHDGGRVENLTAQRSENSVLFSLSNLQSLASPAPAPSKPGTVQSTEGSGLIDIRAMAASTMRAPSAGGLPSFGGGSRESEDDLPAFGAFSSAAPMLLPIPSSSGPPVWVYVLVGLAAVMIIGMGVLAFSILGKPVVADPPAAPPVVATLDPKANQAKANPATGIGSAAGKGTDRAAADEAAAGSSKTIAAGDLPPREGGDSTGPAAAGGDKSGSKTAKKGGGKPKKSGGGAEARSGGGAVAASAGSSAPAESEKAKPAKGSLDDLLEGALNGRRSSGASSSAKPKVDDDGPGKKNAEGGAGAGPLAKGAVVAGMNGVKGKVAACYAQYKVPGMAMVNVVIGKSGKVSGATVTGKFAGTPTGTCVENAVKTASFPPSEGLTTPYPFSLR